MRYALVVLLGMLCWVSPVAAQVSIGIGLPGVSIGNLPSYPQLVVVPEYPVYYAPSGDVNLFFYDGMYWAYQGDNWYASSWYDGPWGLVGPEVVPVFVLRIPVRYYRHPPVAWVGWRSDAPPRWGERWGHDWEQRRSGWDQWDRRTVQAPAPLPVYQRQYSGNRYPRVEQQQALQRAQYHYQPKDPVVRQQYQEQGAQPRPAVSGPSAERQKQQPARAVAQPEQQGPRAQGQQERPQAKGPSKAEPQQPEPQLSRQPQGGPAAQRQPAEPRQPVAQRPKEQSAPAIAQREQPAPRPQAQQERPPQQAQQKQEQGPEQGRGQEKGQGREK